MPLDLAARLLHASQVEAETADGCTLRWLVDRRGKAEHVMAYQVTLEPTASTGHVHAGAEEVFYVIEGEGQVVIEGRTSPLSAGIAIHVPQAAEHTIENTGCTMLTIVGAMSPAIDTSTIRPIIPTIALPTSPSPGTGEGRGGGVADRQGGGIKERSITPTLMKESSVAPTMMGERSFRLLVNPEVGCKSMTQFTGIIPPGRAPLHAHPYEEATYILSGRGRLWIEEEPFGDLRPGSIAFLPIGIRHTLENTTEDQLLKVLGALSPANSPEAKLPPRAI